MTRGCYREALHCPECGQLFNYRHRLKHHMAGKHGLVLPHRDQEAAGMRPQRADVTPSSSSARTSSTRRSTPRTAPRSRWLQEDQGSAITSTNDLANSEDVDVVTGAAQLPWASAAVFSALFVDTKRGILTPMNGDTRPEMKPTPDVEAKKTAQTVAAQMRAFAGRLSAARRFPPNRSSVGRDGIAQLEGDWLRFSAKWKDWIEVERLNPEDVESSESFIARNL